MPIMPTHNDLGSNLIFRGPAMRQNSYTFVTLLFRRLVWHLPMISYSNMCNPVSDILGLISRALVLIEECLRIFISTQTSSQTYSIYRL